MRVSAEVLQHGQHSTQPTASRAQRAAELLAMRSPSNHFGADLYNARTAAWVAPSPRLGRSLRGIGRRGAPDSAAWDFRTPGDGGDEGRADRMLLEGQDSPRRS